MSNILKNVLVIGSSGFMGSINHYGNTPYRYSPKKSMKIRPAELVDLGQGLLDLVEEIHNSL